MDGSDEAMDHRWGCVCRRGGQTRDNTALGLGGLVEKFACGRRWRYLPIPSVRVAPPVEADVKGKKIKQEAIDDGLCLHLRCPQVLAPI